jgi:hypothetical protein
VSGAITLSGEHSSMLRQLLDANDDENPYVESWLFHSEGGWCNYAFFGHTVKLFALERLRAQLKRVASTIRSKDQDVDWEDFVEGHFWVVYDDGEPAYEWSILNGEFHEVQRR